MLLIDDFLEKSHRDKGTRSAHPCAAVDNRGLAFFVVSEKLLDHEVESLLTGRERPVSVGPGYDLVVSDYSFEVGVVIFHMNFSDSELLVLDLISESEFVFFFDHFAAFSFLIGPVSVAFFAILLNQGAEHKDGSDVIFLDHAVEVVECGGEGALSSDNFLAFEFHNVRINIVLNLVFLLLSGQDWFGGVKSHDVRVSVVWKLLGILVQFLQVVLCLGHEGEDLEL